MKKIVSFVLAMICLFALAGCGGTQKTEAPAQKPAAAEKVLRVGTDADYPPFEYYREASKTYTGFDIELMNAVAKGMGYSKVEYVNLEFNNLLPSLIDKQVDVVISCMGITEERSKMADFSEPYLDSGFVVVGPADAKAGGLDAIKDKKLTAEVGTLPAKAAKEYSKDVVECSGAEEALNLVVNKKADFAIMDNYTAKAYVSNNFKAKLAICAEIPDTKDKGIGIAVAKGNKELLDKLNEALRSYRDSAAFVQLKKTYFGNL